MFDIGENITAIIIALFTFLGGVTAGILKFLSVKKKNNSKLDALLDSNTLMINAMNEYREAINENSSISRNIRTILELKFRSSVAESLHEIMEVKNLAWEKQQTDFVNAVRKIIIANHLDNKEVTLMKIRSNLAQIIEVTDASLETFNISSFLASTKGKIKFINESEFPEIIYQIIIDNKNDSEKLESNSRSICQQMLQAVKSEFYDDKGRVKE